MNKNAHTKLHNNFFGEMCTCSYNQDGSVVYTISDKTGSGTMTCYSVFDGITLIYNDFHMYYCRHNEGIFPSIIEINHCREGRIECELDGEYFYMGEGDFSISTKDKICSTTSFPLKHYHGISVVLDFDNIKENQDAIFSSFSLDFNLIREKLFGTISNYSLRGNDSINHIFSELYTVHPSLRINYLKIKVIELLIFLSTPDIFEVQKKKKYYSRIYVDRIKEIKNYICSNIERHYTLNQLSEKFDISLTTMKNCFKEVYGTSIYNFIRTYRMQTAAYFLKNTNDTILSIAGKVGYDNASKFSAAFKEIIKISPNEYRNTFV